MSARGARKEPGKGNRWLQGAAEKREGFCHELSSASVGTRVFDRDSVEGLTGKRAGVIHGWQFLSGYPIPDLVIIEWLKFDHDNL